VDLLTTPQLASLSEILDRPLVGAAGEPVGRLVDVVVSAAAMPPRVCAVIVAPRRGQPVRYSWPDVEIAGGGDIRLRAGALHQPVLDRDAELRLRRDVLDVQIVDLVGRRVTRVGDVALAAGDEGLVAAALEVGAAPIARRLGLRALAPRLPSRHLDWRLVHVASPHGHALQVEQAMTELHRVPSSELARLAGRLNPQRGHELVRAAAARRGEVPAAHHQPRHPRRGFPRLRRRSPKTQ